MKPLITLDDKALKLYIQHLKSQNYKDMNNGAKSIVRQYAQDVKQSYKKDTPKRATMGASGKYGATSGNLQRSLRVFPKRQKDPFIIEFSVGFKSYMNLQQLVNSKKKVNDGYYGWMVNEGVAGRSGSSDKSEKFADKARINANLIIDGQISERALLFLNKKLDKILNK